MNIEELKLIVSKYLDLSECFISEGNGNAEVNLTDIKKKDFKYIIKTFPRKQITVVWNYESRVKNGGGQNNLALTKSMWENNEAERDVVEAQYQELIHKGSNIWEKIYIVGDNHIDAFLKDIQLYMMPNPLDNDFPLEYKNQIGDPVPSIVREKYTAERLKRDSGFRKEVLEAFDYRCFVCGVDIVEVLQAAHEHGYEPGKTNWDDPKHGICLCANHHLMYDKGLIMINKKKITYNEDGLRYYKQYIANNGEFKI